jgi:hypothetical protein
VLDKVCRYSTSPRAGSACARASPVHQGFVYLYIYASHTHQSVALYVGLLSVTFNSFYLVANRIGFGFGYWIATFFLFYFGLHDLAQRTLFSCPLHFDLIPKPPHSIPNCQPWVGVWSKMAAWQCHPGPSCLRRGETKNKSSRARMA